MRLLKNRSISFYLLFFLILTMAIGGSSFTAFANQAAPVLKLQWGTAGTGDGQFGDNLQGVAVDKNGFVYVADLGNSRIQKFTSDGQFVTKWPVTSPTDVKVDASGNIFVVDGGTGSKSVLKFTPDGTLISVFAQFDDAREVAFDPAGNVYIDNHYFGEIDKYAPNGSFIKSWGTPGGVNSSFPVGIAVDSNSDVYVSLNRGGGPTVKFTSDGAPITQFPFGEFKMAIDSNNNLYTADAINNRIQVFTSDGVLLTEWGALGTGNDQFNSPQGIALDAANNVYVADTNNHRIQVFSSPIASGGTGASVAVIAGNLSESGPANVSASPVTLSGDDQTTTYSLPLTVTDARGGNSAGWNLTITSTLFDDGSGHQLASTASNIKVAPTVACNSVGGDCVNPNNSITYPVGVPAASPTPPTAVKFFNAAANTGLGKFTITPTVTISIPANTVPGTYTSQVSVAIVSGP